MYMVTAVIAWQGKKAYCQQDHQHVNVQVSC